MADPKLTVPEFRRATPDEIATTVRILRETFRSGRTKKVEYRLIQLRKLYWAIVDNSTLLQEALRRDLNKSKFEALISEINFVAEDCLFMIKNLEKYARDDPFPDVPPPFMLMKVRVRKEPLGMALVVGAYNFPLVLCLQPLIGAIAAGCTAVLKPSENAPATAMALAKVVADALDPEAYAVVNGAVPEITALLDQKWDKICYTGSNAIGKIVAKKAAETLTPVTLELGGLNPAIVTRNANLKLAARRLMWGKCLNAGQVCLSQNYMLVDRAVLPQFVEALKATYKTFFPNGAKASPDLSRIVNKRQFLRMKKMVDDSRGQIVLGGEMDETELFIAPTVVLVDSIDDTMVKEESFGPIMALLAFDSLDEAIGMANTIDRTPLTLMAFGNESETKKVLDGITSGGANVNESYMNGSIGGVPFGGVGQSGMGAYRGKASFDTFTHERIVVHGYSWLEKLLRVRYMPYQLGQLQRLKCIAPKADFDREGRRVRGLGYVLGLVFGLGAKSSKGALIRWFVVLASSWYALVGKKGWLA